MGRRWYLRLCVLTFAAAASCSRPHRPDTATRPQLRNHSLGRTAVPLGSADTGIPRRGCPATLTADECVRIDSAISALEKNPDPRCRAAGDSAHARLDRAQLEFVQPALAGMAYRHRLEATAAIAEPRMAWVGAEQYDWRGSLAQSIVRTLTTDSLPPDSVAARCRRSSF